MHKTHGASQTAEAVTKTAKCKASNTQKTLGKLPYFLYVLQILRSINFRYFRCDVTKEFKKLVKSRSDHAEKTLHFMMTHSLV